MVHNHDHQQGTWWRSPAKIALFVFLAIAAFFLLASAWEVLYKAQRNHALAVTGHYARVRHPQYLAFMTIMLGFLLQWPTVLTLLMFPVLLWMYTRLAFQEEREVRAFFGEEYVRYSATTPAFFPRIGSAARRSQ